MMKGRCHGEDASLHLAADNKPAVGSPHPADKGDSVQKAANITAACVGLSNTFEESLGSFIEDPEVPKSVKTGLGNLLGQVIGLEMKCAELT